MVLWATSIIALFVMSIILQLAESTSLDLSCEDGPVIVPTTVYYGNRTLACEDRAAITVVMTECFHKVECSVDLEAHLGNPCPGLDPSLLEATAKYDCSTEPNIFEICSSHKAANESSPYYIHSRNFPDYYGVSQQCRFEVVKPEAYFIRLEVLYMDLEPRDPLSQGCYDFVYIGHPNTSAYTQQYCGSTTSENGIFQDAPRIRELPSVFVDYWADPFEEDYQGHGLLIKFQEFSVCENKPCEHGGKCSVTDTEYHCDCAQTDVIFYVGHNCEIEQGLDKQPEVTDIYPTFGPVAGGTQLTITGKNLIIENVTLSVLIGDQLASQVEVTPNWLTVYTPEYGGSEDGGSAPVRLLYEGGFYAYDETRPVFEYMPNPNISNIYPREVLFTGGVGLTVEGTSLDSVSEPQLLVHVQESDSSSVTETHKQPCDDVRSARMVCPSPLLNSTNRATSSYFLGFFMDGYGEYTDLRYSAIPDLASLTVTSLPEVVLWTKVFEYDPDSASDVVIDGGDFTRGFSASDISVRISDSECNVTRVFSNAIVCQPQDPEPTTRSGCRDQGAHPVQLTIGYHSWCVGDLVYESRDWYDVTWRLAMVAAGFGALGLFIFSAIIYCWCCHYPKPKRKYPETEEEGDVDSKQDRGSVHFTQW